MTPETIAALAQLVVSITGAIAAIGAVILSLRNSTKIDVVHKLTNSMHTEVVRAVAKEEHAEGVKEGEENAADRAQSPHP